MRPAAWMRSLAWVAISLSASGADPKAPLPVPLAWPASQSAYQLEYLHSIGSGRDLSIRRGFLSRLGDLVLGAADRPEGLWRPFTVTADPRGRLLVADPGLPGVRLFDPARNRQRLLLGPGRQPMQSPIGADFDASGNIYIADSALGKIFVFDREGRFQRLLGDARGEGLFKRPTGLAVDKRSNRIYLTDTLRHKVYVLDTGGGIGGEWGKRGTGSGEFNFPTAIALGEERVFVLDAMNFRVQVFTAEGQYISSFGELGSGPGFLFRPKGLAVDARNKLVFVVDALFSVIQGFDWEGGLVLAFGRPGSGPGEFRMPAGIHAQPDGRILVADSFNRRIQVFRARRTVASAGRPSS